jgi:site-specific DNA-cytosine methylase
MVQGRGANAQIRLPDNRRRLKKNMAVRILARRAHVGDSRCNGLSLAEEEPERDFVGMPRLTVRMVARLQGFPDDWKFAGKKTTAYRQLGNAFPPPVARAVAAQIKLALSARKSATVRKIKVKAD